jgi:hypothetical protein
VPNKNTKLILQQAKKTNDEIFQAYEQVDPYGYEYLANKELGTDTIFIKIHLNTGEKLHI